MANGSLENCFEAHVQLRNRPSPKAPNMMALTSCEKNKHGLGLVDMGALSTHAAPIQ
jgi:hypothetical protein